MIRSIRSELLKLRRPSVIYGGGGAILAFALLATVLTFLTAETGPARPSNGNDIVITVDQLSAAGGLTRGFSIAAGFIGLLVFVVFLTSVTSEYGHGTLRSLLTRQPRRGRLLAGKLVALVACTAAALLVAEVVGAAAAVAMAMAGVKDIQTGAWFTGSGLLGAAADYANALLNATLIGTLGATLGVVLRSTVLALGGPGLADAHRAHRAERPGRRRPVVPGTAPGIGGPRGDRPDLVLAVPAPGRHLRHPRPADRRPHLRAPRREHVST